MPDDDAVSATHAAAAGDGAGRDDAANAAAYEALRRSAAAVHLSRDVLRAAGPDATTFLQGQLSQDIAAIGAGAAAWSWVLQPAGKVDALVRVTRIGPDELLLDTDAGWGERLAARLGRFKLRTKVDIEVLAGWSVLGLRGRSADVAAAAEGGVQAVEAGVVAVVDGSWPGLAGVDLIGPSPRVPAGMVVAGPAAWGAARIEAGIPVMGAELTERTIPAETGLVERTVSFTKGCYTGQELVARIDSRGSNVPRHLAGFLLEGPAAAGAVVRHGDGAEVGVLTSTARSPASGWVGLGYVRRGRGDGAGLAAGEGDGTVAVRVVELPMAAGR